MEPTTKKYKVLEAFELPAKTPEETAITYEVGETVELSDEQAEAHAGRVELVPAE